MLLLLLLTAIARGKSCCCCFLLLLTAIARRWNFSADWSIARWTAHASHKILLIRAPQRHRAPQRQRATTMTTYTTITTMTTMSATSPQRHSARERGRMDGGNRDIPEPQPHYHAPWARGLQPLEQSQRVTERHSATERLSARKPHSATGAPQRNAMLELARAGWLVLLLFLTAVAWEKSCCCC